MEGLTTKEAFGRLISERNFHQHIEGLSSDAARQLRLNFKKGKVTLDRMEELLIKGKAKIIQEKLWLM
jgi:hypothetical protein